MSDRLTPITDAATAEHLGSRRTQYDGLVSTCRNLERQRNELLEKLEACEKRLEALYGNTADGDEPNREEEEGWILLCEVRATIGKAKGESPWATKH